MILVFPNKNYEMEIFRFDVGSILYHLLVEYPSNIEILRESVFHDTV